MRSEYTHKKLTSSGFVGGEANRNFFIGLARAFGGAVFFSLPLLMTMEMWWLGFYMDRGRLILFMLLMIPVLIGLDHYSGFEATSGWGEDAIDGMVAYGIGFLEAACILLLFNVVSFSMEWSEIVGKISLQAIPASFGAVLATAQLGGDLQEKERRREQTGYGAEVFLMSTGAIFLAFNVAPTEEMLLIAFKMTPLHGLLTLAASLAMMHAFVYAVSFRGTPRNRKNDSQWSLFLRFTVVGYAVALLISAYVLWTFGRFEGGAYAEGMMQTIVLAFPASLGAAAARLILS